MEKHMVVPSTTTTIEVWAILTGSTASSEALKNKGVWLRYTSYKWCMAR